MYPRATVNSRHRAGPEQAVFPVLAPPGLSPNALLTSLVHRNPVNHRCADAAIIRWRLTLIPRIGCGGRPASFLHVRAFHKKYFINYPGLLRDLRETSVLKLNAQNLIPNHERQK
jgi:hypothetical protein